MSDYDDQSDQYTNDDDNITTQVIGADDEEKEDIDVDAETEEATNASVNDVEILNQFMENRETYKNDKVDEVDIVVDPEHRMTSDRLTEFEVAEAIGIRAIQIAKEGKSYNGAINTDAKTLAERELLEGKSPLILVRRVGKKYIERWDINTMAKPIGYNFGHS